jgi:hypothetical protein
MLWKGAWASESTTPSIYYNGASVNVRTALWIELGKKIQRGHAIKPSCGEHACVAPGHLVSRNYRSVPKSATARANFTKQARARGKLSEEIAAEIRASDETPTQWAQRLGVSLQAVCDVRSYRRWAPTLTPFSGLGARA